jgi:hypothetical protein
VNAVFPFGLPPATALYLVLYVVTLSVHVVFMNYCLAGSLYLTWKLRTAKADVAAGVLRDWLPFALGAAITAGVAPLLFLQILYKREFYTANLLLLHRWMSILLVLMAAFYLCYILKTAALQRRPPGRQALVAAAVFACIGFTGFTWTENHVLSLQSQEVWSTHYAQGLMWYRDAQLWPRFGLWFFGSWPIMAALLSWQLRAQPDGTAAVPVGRMALAGLAAAAACAALALVMMPDAQRAALLGRLAAPYTAVALGGVALQGGAWLRVLRRRGITPGTRAAVSAGAALTVLGTSVAREALRLAAVDVSSLYDLHARAGRMGGLAVFLAFAGINAVLIAWSVNLARKPSAGAGSQSPPGAGS